MSSTTDFVSELYRAANEVAKLSTSERRRLIERALTAIADLWDFLSKHGNIAPLPSTLMSGIRSTLDELEEGPDLLASHLLLECADEIRKLRILIEAC